MSGSSWLILFKTGPEDLTPLHMALEKYQIPIQQPEACQLILGKFPAELDVYLHMAPHVLEESQEMAVDLPHPDSAEIAHCDRRIELSWDSKDFGSMTTLLGYVEPEIRKLVGKSWTLDCEAAMWL